MSKRKSISSTFWMRKELMSNSKDIIVKLRLLVKPPINVDNFFYKVTYTKFGYQNEDGSHVSPKTIAGKFVKFTVNSSANKNGLLAIESEDIVLLDHKRSIQKAYLPDAKNGSAWFQIENRSNGKVVRKNKYPQWSYRHKREISEYKWDTTSSKNSTTPNTKKTQKIKQKCPHTVDGAIEVAKYIVDEIKRNVKSDTTKSIYHLLERWKNPQWFDAIGGSNPAKLYTSALGLWGLKVAPGMPWDHKPIIAKDENLRNLTVTRPTDADNPSSAISKSHFHKYKDYDYFYDVWSNIHYGYVGMAAGFDENTLLDGSDLQQSLNLNTEGADTSDDRTTMIIGINLYKKFGRYAEHLNFQHILDILNDKPIRNNFEYSKQAHWCYNLKNKNRVK